MRVKCIIFVHNPVQWRFPVSSTVIWPLIRLVTRSYWNHVQLLVEVNGRDMIVEAKGSGVVMTSVDNWVMSSERKIKMIAVDIDGTWLYETLGIKYDYTSLLFWKVIKIFTGRWHGPVFEKAKKAIFCSELAAMAVGCEEPWGISPQDLYQHLLSQKQANVPGL